MRLERRHVNRITMPLSEGLTLMLTKRSIKKNFWRRLPHKSLFPKWWSDSEPRSEDRGNLSKRHHQRRIRRKMRWSWPSRLLRSRSAPQGSRLVALAPMKWRYSGRVPWTHRLSIRHTIEWGAWVPWNSDHGSIWRVFRKRTITLASTTTTEETYVRPTQWVTRTPRRAVSEALAAAKTTAVVLRIAQTASALY